jgi:energy-coupling factor transport system ATP-binding protein
MPKTAVSLHDLHFAYTNHTPVLHGINLEVPAGQYVALVGANGSGKSTLLKHLVGLLRPTRGAVQIMGKATVHLPVGEMARLVGFAFQHPEHQIFSATVRSEVAFGPRNLGLHGDVLAARVAETLDQFGLASYADHPPAVLSFSLRRLVALASIAALRPPVLALDEPLVGLDGLWRRRVVAWLRAHHETGGTVILVTHHMRLAAKCDRVVVLNAGRVAADGPPAEVFAQPDLLHAAGLDEPMVVALARRLGVAGVPLSVRELAAALERRSVSP